MVPSAFMQLEALPTNSSGKLDRKKLPAPLGDVKSGEVVYHNEAEPLVAQLVGDVLGVAAVSLSADFFELGGNSLSAVLLLSREESICSRRKNRHFVEQ